MNNTYQDMTNHEKSVSLLPLVTILFKRKWIIISFFFSVVGVVTLATFLMSDVFTINTKLMIEREMDSEKALLFRMNPQSSYQKYDWINSEIEIIKSHPVAIRVVDSLKLYQNEKENKESSYGIREKFEKAVTELQKKVIVEASKKSNVIEISYETKDPELGAKVVNKVVETYVNYRSQIDDETEAYEFFEKQLNITDQKIRELEKRLANYKQVKEMISPEAQKDILLTRLAEYEKSMTDVHTKRISKGAKLTLIREQLNKGQELSIPSTESSDSPSREKYIAKLRGDVLDLEIQREQLLQKYTPQYEDVIKLDKQIAKARKRIEVEIYQIMDMELAAIKALRTEERVLQSAIDKTVREIKELAQKEYEYSQLSRGLDDNREVYSMLLKQREEARISLSKLQKGVRVSVISPAIVPTEPTKPNKTLNVVIALFLGIVGGLSLALIVEYFDHSINSQYELERFADLPVLGSVREVNRDKAGAQPKVGVRVTKAKMLPPKHTYEYS